MSGGGADAPPPSPSPNGGDFLLKLIQKPSQYQHQSSPPPPTTETLPHDPAVAAIWPSFPFPPIPSPGPDLAYRPTWSHSSPPFAPHNFFAQGFPQNPNPNPKPNPNPNRSSSPQSQPQPPPGFNNTRPQFNQNSFGDEFRKLGFLGETTNSRSNPSHLQEHNLVFGSLPPVIRNSKGVSNGHSYDNLASVAKVDTLSSKERDMVSGNNRRLNGLEVEFQSSRNQQQSSGTYRSAVPSPEVRRPPPGFQSKPSVGNREFGNRKSSLESKVDKGKSSVGELKHRGFTSNHEDKRETRFLPGRNKRYVDMSAEQGLRGQLDWPGPPAGSNLPSVSASDIEESLLELHAEGGDIGEEPVSRMQNKMRRGGQSDVDDLEGHLMDSLVLEDESDDKNDRKKKHGSRDKDYRSDKRGQWLLSQRMRISKSQIECRIDVNRLNTPFLAIYESLVPAAEEKEKQKQLLTLLEKLVSKEWPEARLYIYGSCANSFGFSKSDIDICLLIEDTDVNKSEVLLKLADILESDSLQNVQALTRARVPIVKLMDPITGISCDICVNNVLAVVNTKLLRDYAQIDVRLRQLAFIVKHWAKSRGVNETYRGTLSSYAYVLMCIHFLQKRKPAILPCLQGMERTYSATIDNIECTYFDQVERLHGFGSRNGESIAQLVWAFFNYWAYCHDYANDVISVRTGSILSKQAKDWTRRIGNDRHLICIEDPFEVSHDLGRVVDKYSIRVLREEFERAAEIMQHDPNPCVRLFEPYISG